MNTSGFGKYFAGYLLGAFGAGLATRGGASTTSELEATEAETEAEAEADCKTRVNWAHAFEQE